MCHTTLSVLLLFIVIMLCCTFSVFFFFKQKTAYDMRISDWSSDVCSSDLMDQSFCSERDYGLAGFAAGAATGALRTGQLGHLHQIGRASCRERVCQYV